VADVLERRRSFEHRALDDVLDDLLTLFEGPLGNRLGDAAGLQRDNANAVLPGSLARFRRSISMASNATCSPPML
jgi:hypothetical protein